MSIIKVDLPVLKKLKELNSQGSKASQHTIYKLIAIQHLLKDTLIFLLELKPIFDDIFVIGIPYSNRDEVIQELRKEGIVVNTPTLEELESYSFLTPLIKDSITDKNGKRIPYVILEDGGYIGKCLHENSESSLTTCCGAVEQTKAGLWRYQELRDNKKLKIPVFTVANSELKDIAEAPEVGEAVVRNTEDLLNKIGVNLTEKNFFILGYGWIGLNTAKSLRRRTSNILVFDGRNVRRLRARLDGFQTSAYEDGIKWADIIIGITGRRSLKTESFKNLRNGPLKANDLAIKAGIPSGRVYEVIMSLVNKGWLKKTGERPSIYDAQNPRQVLQRELEKLQKKMDESLVDAEQAWELRTGRIGDADDKSWTVSGIHGIILEVRNLFTNAKSSVKMVDSDISWFNRGDFNKFEDLIKQGIKISVVSSNTSINELEKLGSIGVQVYASTKQNPSFYIIDNELVLMKLFSPDNGTVVRDTTLAKMFDDKYNEIIKGAKLVKVERDVT
jgi:sugar-specific transcriptional regulator TrmB